MDTYEIETPTEQLIEEAIDRGDAGEAKRLLRAMVGDWRRNKDGSQDRRFNNNYQLPVVRCGILLLQIDGADFRMMTTHPDAPGLFVESLPEPETVSLAGPCSDRLVSG